MTRTASNRAPVTATGPSTATRTVLAPASDDGTYKPITPDPDTGTSQSTGARKGAG